MNRKKDYFCTTIKFIENPTQTHWMKHYQGVGHHNGVHSYAVVVHFFKLLFVHVIFGKEEVLRIPGLTINIKYKSLRRYTSSLCWLK